MQIEQSKPHLNSKNVLENVDCLLCGPAPTRLVEPAGYTSPPSERELQAIYSSSSDVKRLDAMVQCEKCELVYLNPRVSEQIVLQSYGDAIDPQFFEQNPSRIRTFKRLFKRVSRKLGGLSKESRILDIGSGGGAFLKGVQDLGYEAIGVEPSRWLGEKARSVYGVDLRTGLLIQQNFKNHAFSVVTLWDVLEHLSHPEKELQEVSRILEPGGVLVVSVPDYGSTVRKLMQSKWPFFLNVHLFYFTQKTMRKFLKQNGFDLITTFPLWQTLELGYVFKRAAQIISFFHWFEKLIRIFRLGSLPMTYQMGQTVFIARKI